MLTRFLSIVPPVDTESFQRLVAGAVRAELARANKKSVELAEVLGLSRQTIYGRMSGVYPFTTTELEKAADFIGITAQDIMLSAALPERFGHGRANDLVAVPDPRNDAWAQPSRSRRRGHKRGPTIVERGRRGAHRDDDEGAEDIRRTLEYAESIDPDNKLPKEELRHLMRMKFPEFDW